jgi:hypothetical protein
MALEFDPAVNYEDETWDVARRTVQECLEIPAVLPTLVRKAWLGTVTPREFVRHLGFIRINGICLIRAAELPIRQDDAPAVQVEQAIQVLGPRTASVIVAIHHVCDAVLETTPPDRLWVSLFRDTMNAIEVGYWFGSRAEGIGSEGGMLMGFVRFAGLSILMAQNPRRYAEWFVKTRGVERADITIEHFGCEAYQVGAFAVQQLGFGAEIAIATTLAVGKLKSDLLELPVQVHTWKAAFDWVEAFRQGLSCPRDVSSRDFFRELAPPKKGQSASPSLGLLYSQIGAIRRKSSSWTWHLPLGTYEDQAKTLHAKRTEKRDYRTSRTGVFPARD